MTNEERKQPWLVRIHHRMRTISFGMLFVATSLQIAGKGYGLPAWAALALVLLVYPHVQYWRACRAENPIDAEMRSLSIDSVLLGMYVAALGFTQWLSFSAVLGTLANNAVNKGWRGLGVAVLAVAGGAAMWIALAGFRFSPESELPTTLACMGGLAGYLLAVGILGHSRNVQLRLAREQLTLRKRQLIDANESLLKSLGEIDELHHQLTEQANRDPLTGLYNRRYLDSTLERELARCKREGQSLSLILIDIDHFKKINDTYGHQAGDEMLSRFGKLLASTGRAADVACRYGGEEFLLLMPTMSLDSARERAEELRATFQALAVRFGDFRLQTTVSIGISVYPGHGTSADELFRSADDALYRAKRGGRNRIEARPLGPDRPAEELLADEAG